MEYISTLKEIFETLAIPLSLLLAVYKLHQNWKAKFIVIGRDNQDRYLELNKSKGQLYKYFKMIDFSMDKVAEDDHHDLSHLMERFFWYFFHMWIEGHDRKSLPGYLKRDWDFAIKDAMTKPIFQEFWQAEFRHRNFMNKLEYKRFIDRCLV
ncbi:hypothetical protein [Candidatus Uabimicrobium amorphum]|uniref:Uncharacterized protein n=1 Tax=Uabimicrobium amorphum TaxID=2596890 RepID=A0A5S9F5Y0_UABAM|nr:hypothetical protein [Candidatus Uabimicrobium amorphum]BBM87098.1 hypothetical protein UABAM_05501 [Candidatus Uabimicrobium amorphum]